MGEDYLEMMSQRPEKPDYSGVWLSILGIIAMLLGFYHGPDFY